MRCLEGRNVVVTGDNRSLGLGIVGAPVTRRARVTVVARDPGRLNAVSSRRARIGQIELNTCRAISSGQPPSSALSL
jgi:NAD(P)-dependent dehydrogenase (short-subunit alcohol dehydrogenase family)